MHLLPKQAMAEQEFRHLYLEPQLFMLAVEAVVAITEAQQAVQEVLVAVALVASQQVLLVQPTQVAEVVAQDITRGLFLLEHLAVLA
jgi:aminoglycoside/choline kinase family phosphotransferase